MRLHVLEANNRVIEIESKMADIEKERSVL